MATINDNYREFKLSNGLHVALQETPTQTVSGRLKVWNGALNEKPGEEGLAHFLEHTLVTGGSQKYEPEEADKIRGVFGAFNASTGLNQTTFPVDMLAEDTALFIEYISDAIFNPRFAPARVEEERNRVLREIADAKSNFYFKIHQIYNEAFFGKNSPHTYSILGNESVIATATQEKIRDFHGRGYYPNNISLILVGALPQNIEELIEQHFGGFEPKNTNRIEFPRNPPLCGATFMHIKAPGLLNLENPEQSSAELSMSLAAPTETDEDSSAVDMLIDILGGGASSMLFTNVSQRKGLAYGIGAGYNGNNNTGRIFIQGNVPSRRKNEVMDAIFEEMDNLRTKLVPQYILERLKRISKYRIAKTFETNCGHVNAIELRIEKGITPESHLEKMDRVTPEKIRDAARKYFPDDKINGNYLLLLKDPLKE